MPNQQSNQQSTNPLQVPGSGARTMALVAALLGWLFDGFEMGLFPVVARPAVMELLGDQASDALFGRWYGVITAAFLVGAATGGVLFGWLGDRVGRIRAMTLSILTYAIVSALGAFAQQPWHLMVVRFLAALGMGGEWSLGVALVMEIWQGRSRGLLAGLIGAAGNLGYVVVALLSLFLVQVQAVLGSFLTAIHIPQAWIDQLAANSGWRMLMLMGILPALLTLGIRFFVPESQSWKEENTKGTTKGWATKDLLGILVGSVACFGILALWANDVDWAVRIVGTAGCLGVVTIGYLWPIRSYLARNDETPAFRRDTMSMMLIAAGLSGVALLGTWGSVLWSAPWADKLSDMLPGAKQWTQFWSAMGATLGCLVAALLGERFSRRWTYASLLVISLGSAQLFFRTNETWSSWFFVSVFFVGACTASFYGWLPLYLPELFPTRVRATGQGFGFNFGRILAAIGALQTGALMDGVFKGDYGRACAAISFIYLAGFLLLPLMRETHGKPLPD
ncbi:MAG: MFS transporter [Planctomycetota bacterium]|nr:MFS transporter [Planctomycetota bacterium]